MQINYLKFNPRPGEQGQSLPQAHMSLATAALIMMAAMPLMSCYGQTGSSEPEPSSAGTDLQRLLNVKNAAIASADRQYENSIDMAEKSYEKSLLQARTTWSDKISAAKSTAVTALRALSSRLATAGRLGETVEVLKAVYALSPQDPEVAKALAQVGVDVKVIPTELDHDTRGAAA